MARLRRRHVAERRKCRISISVYVLVAIIKKELRIELSPNEILQILSVTLFEKTLISQALTQTPPQIANTMAYVERNPVRAGMVRQAWDYLWSSAAAHVNGNDPSDILDLAAWRVPSAEWRLILQKREDDDFLTAIRNRTSTGRPLATDSTLSKLEALLNKRLRPLRGGRPPQRAGGERQGQLVRQGQGEEDKGQN